MQTHLEEVSITESRFASSADSAAALLHICDQTRLSCKAGMMKLLFTTTTIIVTINIAMANTTTTASTNMVITTMYYYHSPKQDVLRASYESWLAGLSSLLLLILRFRVTCVRVPAQLMAVATEQIFFWRGSPSSCLRSGRGKWLSRLYLQEVWKMQLRPVCFLSRSVKPCLGFCSAPNRSRLKTVQPGELLPDCAASAMTTVMVRFKNAERGRYLARRDDKVIVLPKDATFNKDEVAWKLGIYQKPVLTFANYGMKSVSSLELYNVRRHGGRFRVLGHLRRVWSETHIEVPGEKRRLICQTVQSKDLSEGILLANPGKGEDQLLGSVQMFMFRFSDFGLATT